MKRGALPDRITTHEIAQTSNEVHGLAKEHLSFEWLKELIEDPDNLNILADAHAELFLDGMGLRNLNTKDSYDEEAKLRMCLAVVWLEGFATGMRCSARERV